MKNICMSNHEHEWEFYYNMGVEPGTSIEKTRELLATNKAFPVYRCKCGRQAKRVDGKLFVLKPEEFEEI